MMSDPPESQSSGKGAQQGKWNGDPALFRNAIESLPYPFYLIDAQDYRILYANPTASAMDSFLVNTPCYKHIHRRDRPCGDSGYTCPLRKVRETGEPVTVEHTHFDGEGREKQVEVHCYPVFDDEGEVVQVIEYDMDITERRRVEEELEESRERFRSVLYSAHDAIISADSSGKVTFWNEAAERMFGYGRSEMTGSPVSILMPERFRERHRKGMVRVVTTGETRIIGRTVELAGLRKGGEEFPIELSLARWKTKKGLYFTGIVRDITERKRVQEELQRANERMKSDIEAAAEAQRSLLPGEYLEFGGVRFARAFRPCEELGGDIFNVFRLDERYVGIYILDVSGHGVPAALLAVTLSHILSPATDKSSLIRQPAANSAGRRIVPPSDVATRLNRQFPMDPDKLQYFTFLYGILDLETHLLRYVSAGHPGPIHMTRGSEAVVLQDHGFPIGWFEDAEYREYTLEMKPGDRLYMYSDGITEAVNAADEQLGEARLAGLITRSRGEPVEGSVSFLLGSVVEWLGGRKLVDDISVLGIEIGEPRR